ncbi:MAG: CvpA family protein [Sphaerobacter sp.]|nr:CvpA family protein [Sphaerobacter sp.]
MNWLDVIIILIVLLGAGAGVRRGFLRGALDLVIVAIGLVAGAVGYRPVAQLLERVVGAQGIALNVLSFAAVTLVAQGLLSGVLAITVGPGIAVVRAVPPVRWLDELLGLVPGAIKGLILATLLVLAATLLTLGPLSDTGLSRSRLAAPLVARSARAIAWAQARTGLDLADFTVFTEPAGEQGVRLPFRVTEGLAESPADEAAMLELLNQERREHGLAPLRADAALQAVARDHAREMFTLGYFAHVSPVSGTPADRLQAAGIRYTVAGENLAYAPTVAIAHRGLMQSPGHRANILSPEFTRVGIGVISGPTGGKMFTQAFAGD